MINKDGQPAYSDVVVLSQKNAAGNVMDPITIYPVPAKNHIFIRALRGGRMKIYDGAGRAVMVVDLKKGIDRISIQQLKRGVYYAKANGHSVKFIKE